MHGCGTENSSGNDAGYSGPVLSDNEFLIEELAGSYSNDQPSSFNIPLNLSTKYSSISDVSLYLEGFATSGRAILTDTAEEIEIPVEFRIYITNSYKHGQFGGSTSFAEFSAPENAFNVQESLIPISVVAIDAHYVFSPDLEWTALKDGAAILRFSWSSGCPDKCSIIVQPKVEILSAILVVDGSKIE